MSIETEIENKLLERIKILEDALLFARMRLGWIAEYRDKLNDELEEQGEGKIHFEDEEHWQEIEKYAREGNKVLLDKFMEERKI